MNVWIPYCFCGGLRSVSHKGFLGLTSLSSFEVHPGCTGETHHRVIPPIPKLRYAGIGAQASCVDQVGANGTQSEVSS